MKYFIMTSSGLDGQLNAATFGPFHDLALARLVKDRLVKMGEKCSIETEGNAALLDHHGVNRLKAKNPAGIDFE